MKTAGPPILHHAAMPCAWFRGYDARNQSYWVCDRLKEAAVGLGDSVRKMLAERASRLCRGGGVCRAGCGWSAIHPLIPSCIMAKLCRRRDADCCWRCRLMCDEPENIFRRPAGLFGLEKLMMWEVRRSRVVGCRDCKVCK